MEKRLEKLELIDERKYDKEIEKWPCIVCVIDEFPTFIRKLTAGKGNKLSYMLVADLLERARKVKIHLILATQDATQGNIAIKNTNFDAAIAFMCTNEHSSRAIINAPDARNLSEKGAMYFKCYQHDGLKRMQGSFMKPDEIMDMLDNIKLDGEAIRYDEIKSELRSLARLNDVTIESDSSIHQDTDEEIMTKIIMWLLGQNKISNKQIKDHFEMGYDRAKAFLSKLEASNLVTNQKTGSKLSRTVIPKSMDDIPVKVMELLMGCGYTEADVKNVLDKRSGIADE